MRTRSENKTWFLKGMKDGIPIALGYFAVSFSLGIAVKSAGITPTQIGVMSAMMLASAGQFAAVNVIATAGTYLQMVITTIVVNMRYLLMSSAMSQKFDPKMKFRHRFFLAFFVTDEIFGIAMNTEGRLNPFYNYGAAAVAVPGWSLGAFLGAFAGSILPTKVEVALGVALYGMFLAIIIPGARKNRFIAGIVIISMVLSYLMATLPVASSISSGTRLVILTLAISAIAALIRPISEEEEGTTDAA